MTTLDLICRTRLWLVVSSLDSMRQLHRARLLRTASLLGVPLLLALAALAVGCHGTGASKNAEKGTNHRGSRDEANVPSSKSHQPKQNLSFVGSLGGHTKPVTCLDFSPNGNELVSGSEDGTVRVWDAETGALRRTYINDNDHSGVIAIKYCPVGERIALCRGDDMVEVLEVTALSIGKVSSWHLSHPRSLAWSPDATAIAVSHGTYNVSVFIPTTGIESYSVNYGTRGDALAFSPSGAWLATFGWSWIELLDAFTAEQVGSSPRNIEEAPDRLFFSPNGEYLAYGTEREAGFIRCSNPNELVPVWGNGWGDYGLIGATRDNTFLLMNQGSVFKCDPDLPNPPTKLFEFDGLTLLTASSNGGRVAAWDSNDFEIAILDAMTGTRLHSMGGHAAPVVCVSMNSNAPLLASGGEDGSVVFWNPTKATYIRRTAFHESRINSLAFSPDGQILASASSDRVIALWEVKTGLVLHVLKGHFHAVTSVAFSPDGTLIASGSEDCTVRLWEVRTGNLATEVMRKSGPVNSVAFTADGSFLISGIRRDGTYHYINRVDIAKPSSQHNYGLNQQVFARAGLDGYVINFEPTGLSKLTATKFGNDRFGGVDESAIDFTKFTIAEGKRHIDSVQLALVHGVVLAAQYSNDKLIGSWSLDRIATSSDNSLIALVGDAVNPLIQIQVWRLSK